MDNKPGVNNKIPKEARGPLDPDDKTILATIDMKKEKDRTGIKVDANGEIPFKIESSQRKIESSQPQKGVAIVIVGVDPKVLEIFYERKHGRASKGTGRGE